jgi:DNA-binding LacI/PurR family transcriptional regulator
MAATIKDIARKLSISTSTVSYALNGGPRTVPIEVRDRVLAVARELNYRPNRIARSLITRRSNTIGVVPTEASVNLAVTPYFQSVLNGILNTAEILGHDVLIYTRYDVDKPDAFVDTLLDGRADGLIFLAPRIDSHALHRLASEIPFVVTSDERRAAPNFGCDNAGGVRKVVDHLAALGHTKIGHVTGDLDMADGINRREAFKTALFEKNLPVRADWIYQGTFESQGGYDAGKQVFASKDRPTAIFCANDECALGLLRSAWEKGVRVPEDLSIVGFDNSPVSSASFPPITTVRQPLDEIGAAAMKALVNFIETQQRPDGISFETELIVRASTSSPQED